MPSALVTALMAPLLELQASVGSGVFAGVDPAMMLRGASQVLTEVAGVGATAINQVAGLWSGTAADAAGQAMSTALAGVTDLASDAFAIASRVGTASDAVARAKSELQRIIDEFEATAAALEPQLPASAGALAQAARRALDDAAGVVGELESELDGHASAVSQLTPANATSPAGVMPSAMPSFGELPATGSPAMGSGLTSGLLAGLEPLTETFTGADPDLGDGVAVRLPDGSTATAPNAIAADAVRHALTQLGVAYDWGGTTPGVGLDCSGLTQWAYHEAGLNLPRLAEDQDVGAAVSPSALLPGDLAVWDGHVAMVVGNGMMIEAGDPVQLSPIRTTNLGQGFQGFWRPTA